MIYYYKKLNTTQKTLSLIRFSMFSVIFPGQGSQSVGMANNLYSSYSYIKELFDEADEILGFSLSKIITNGPREKLDQTENTQFQHVFISLKIFKRQRPPRMAYLLRKMVGATGIEHIYKLLNY